jgi:hypothetical protein
MPAPTHGSCCTLGHPTPCQAQLHARRGGPTSPPFLPSAATSFLPTASWRGIRCAAEPTPQLVGVALSGPLWDTPESLDSANRERGPRTSDDDPERGERAERPPPDLLVSCTAWWWLLRLPCRCSMSCPITGLDPVGPGPLSRRDALVWCRRVCTTRASVHIRAKLANSSDQAVRRLETSIVRRASGLAL